MGLSCYLPLADTLAAEAAGANADVPIFMGHGEHDGVISYAFGARSAALLEDQGLAVEWHGYAAEHTVTLTELRDIEAWLGRVLTPVA